MDITPRHPIGVVSNRTGIPPDLLRAWERRYGAVEPQRTETGRRLYSDRDVKRLSLLRRLVATGRRISDVAALPLEDLVELAEEDRKAMATDVADVDTAAGLRPSVHLTAALEATEQLDKDALEAALSEAALSMSPAEMRKDVLSPLLRELGERWRKGSLRVVHEHVATSIVRAFVDGMRNRTPGNGRPRIVLAAPAGQRHELGALMAAAVAEEVGWNAIYFGADIPGEEIAAGAHKVEARAVALSVTYKSDAYKIAEQLRAVRNTLGPKIAIIVGGMAAPAISQAIDEVDGILVNDYAELQYQLEELISLTA